MSTARPDYVKCVAVDDVEHRGLSWCGKRLDLWHFLGIDHAALNGRQGGRLVACPECTEAIITALRNGHPVTGG